MIVLITKERTKFLKMLNNRNMDMLQGSFWDKLIIFALPLALTGVLQQLFNAADVAVLGKYVGKNAMAAVGNNISIIGIMVNLFLGLSLGSNVVIAQFIGARQSERVGAAVQTSFILALFTGLGIAVIGEILTGPIINWLEVPLEVKAMAETYLRVYLLGIPVMGIYNFEAAILRARGDTKTPLIALAAASIANVGLNVLFVTWGWGVAGVAVATDLANVISAGILFWTLTHTDDILRLRLDKWQFQGELLVKVVKIGLPAGIQGMVFSLSNILIQAAINSLGADAMAASAAAFTIEINVYCFLSAFAQATTTFVSQNYGAGNIVRCYQITKVGLLLSIAATMGMAVIVLCFAQSLLAFFNPDPKVIELGIIRLWYIVAPEFIQAFIDVLSGAMRGYGFSLAPAILTLLGICGVRITWLYTLFPVYPTYDVLMACYSVSWFIAGLFIVLLYRFFKHHLKLN